MQGRLHALLFKLIGEPYMPLVDDEVGVIFEETDEESGALLHLY